MSLRDSEAFRKTMENAKNRRIRFPAKSYWWEELKEFLIEYMEKHSNGYDKNGDYAVYGRYCVSISIDDLLEKMDEIEKKC